MESQQDHITTHFKEHSVAEFFKKNKQMLGFSGKTRSLTTIIHEYITNSLDACDEHGILPNINVELSEIEEDKYKVVVQDNGPGIPKKLIGKALGQMLAGTKFHRFVQQRGQQGIGAAGCTMYSLLTTGKPVHVISGDGKNIISCDISIDFKTNAPLITNLTEREGSMRGLIVEAYFADVKYDKGQYGVFEYLKRTAISNPHLTLKLSANGETVSFNRSVEQIPQKPVEVQPHPLGLGANDLLDYARNTKNPKLSGFLTSDFARFSSGKLDELKELLPTIDFSKKPSDLTWDEAESMIKAIKKLKWIAPPMEGVIPIGQEQIEKSLMNILRPEFLSVNERKPKLYRGGVPFIIETAIAYGGETKPCIMRYANRVPLTFDNSACAMSEVVKDIEWKRYGVDKIDEEPIAILISISSVHVPYISAGKTAISQEEDIMQEIKNALQEAARDIKIKIGRKKRAGDMEKKKKSLMRYVRHLSENLILLSGAGKSEELERLLNQVIQEKYSSALFEKDPEENEEKKPEKSAQEIEKEEDSDE